MSRHITASDEKCLGPQACGTKEAAKHGMLPHMVPEWDAAWLDNVVLHHHIVRGGRKTSALLRSWHTDTSRQSRTRVGRKGH